MASFNRVILLGNLTRAPEMRQTATGKNVTRLRLAVNESYRDRQSGELREIVCYVDIVVWDRQAETCNQYLDKGSQVLVDGRLVYEEWQSAQGESRNRLSVRADRVQFMSRREDVSGGSGGSGSGSGEAETGGVSGGSDDDGYEAAALAAESHTSGDDEDLPF